MNIADEVAHRALSYVEVVSRQGYKLSVEEFEAYVSNPLPVTIGRSSAVGLTSLLALAGALAQQVSGTEPESATHWLLRLRWLSIDENVVTLTSLGHVVLKELEEKALEPDTPL